MFEQDYLMRMILQLVEGIRRSMERSRKQLDPASAADGVEATIEQATDLDGSILLSLAPESIADILLVSGTDPAVVEFVGRSLQLEADYLFQAGNHSLSDLRLRQAHALADAYGFELEPMEDLETRMVAYLDSLSE